MAGTPHYNNTYIRVPTAYSDHAGFGANDLPNYGSYSSSSMQRSLSRVSDETGSYGSPGFALSPGASLDSYDYNLDSTQYNHRQAPPRSGASTRGSYVTASYTDESVPRYGDAYESQYTMAESRNLQPSSIQSSRSPEYICLYEGCSQKPFKRSADLDRHIKHVHKKPVESAVGTGPFGRKDHCRDHYRTFHKEDLCRRNGKEEPRWFDDRNISTSWWRCTKCLKRVSCRDYGWECNDCEQRLEPERMNARKRRLGLAATDPRLQVALTLDTPCNGVSRTPDGRLFVLYARVDGTQAQGLPELVEWVNGTGLPYPDAKIAPDGSLWIVDTGSPGFGEPAILPAGPKLVVVDTGTDSVSRVYGMGNVTKSGSLLDDIRFDWARGRAYLTDAGVGALIVLDLDSGRAVRLLEGDLSVQAFAPLSGEGRLLPSSGGGFSYLYADQLEVSPDGTYLYYQPASGGMSRIETRWLDEAFYNSSAASLDVLRQHVEPFALTPATGGTAIDAEGSLYVSDTDRQAVEKVYPNGTRTTLVQDDRLLWVDAMWIDEL
ncbi:hypothetical protein VMCG_09136 [Cytospora schulzeri]|uniref:C2H2-type domain-containing protein n=1 Tax=Cytospora schulzeri TaxID=448051 RepID=A0A423VMZ7_9PEZI|nr:hypothetical protein VMCG_09136 [Valsa malicola]